MCTSKSLGEVDDDDDDDELSLVAVLVEFELDDDVEKDDVEAPLDL